MKGLHSAGLGSCLFPNCSWLRDLGLSLARRIVAVAVYRRQWRRLERTRCRGSWHRTRAGIMSEHASVARSKSPRSPSGSVLALVTSFRSWPAGKTEPSAAMTMTWTPASAANSSVALCRRSISTSDRALSGAGRLSRISGISPMRDLSRMSSVSRIPWRFAERVGVGRIEARVRGRGHGRGACSSRIFKFPNCASGNAWTALLKQPEGDRNSRSTLPLDTSLGSGNRVHDCHRSMPWCRVAPRIWRGQCSSAFTATTIEAW